MRIGFAQVVPRHMTAPPQWIGGCAGCICALTAEWMPSAPMSSVPVASEVEPSASFDKRADAAVGILSVAGHAVPEPDRLRPDPLHQLFMQQHVKLATMNRVLRPVVASQEPSGLGIDVIAVEPDQRPFSCGQAHPVEVILGEAEIIEFSHGIGLQIDADAERAHFPDRFDRQSARSAC